MKIKQKDGEKGSVKELEGKDGGRRDGWKKEWMEGKEKDWEKKSVREWMGGNREKRWT